MSILSKLFPPGNNQKTSALTDSVSMNHMAGFNPGAGVMGPVPSIFQQAPDTYLYPAQRRRILMELQTLFLNKSLEYYHIDLANYETSVFSHGMKEYGGALPTSTRSQLMMDLDAMAYVPNKALGEVEPSPEQQAELIRLHMQRQNRNMQWRHYSAPRVDDDYQP